MSGPERPLVASGSQTIGPFFHVGPGASDRLGMLAAAETEGERIRLRIAVLDGEGRPVSDALIEIWQADAAGHYSVPTSQARTASGFTGFGRLGTGEDGTCEFQTIRPGRVCDDGGAREAAHLNLIVFARGLLRHLYTRVYFDGDPDTATDPLLTLVPADRRSTLMARPSGDGTWDFTICLQGDRETVFFDV